MWAYKSAVILGGGRSIVGAGGILVPDLDNGFTGVFIQGLFTCSVCIQYFVKKLTEKEMKTQNCVLE